MSLKKLHRIYFGFDGKPDPYFDYLETWKSELPDYEIFHWNTTNLPLENCYFSKMMYDLKDHAFLSDYFRWWVLREHGGVYLDADIEIVNGNLFNQIIEELEHDGRIHSFIGIDNKFDGWYTGHSMASKKGSPLAVFMCEVYEGLGHISFWRRKIFYFMAPQMTALYFAKNGHHVDGMGTTPRLENPTVIEGVKIYPQEWFSPLSPSVDNGIGSFVINGYTKNTCICHHFSCSWHDDKSAYKTNSIANSGTRKLMLLDDIVKTQKIKKKSFYNFKVVKLIYTLFLLMKKIPLTFRKVYDSI